MGKIRVRVLSENACGDINFRNISEISHASKLNADDTLLIVDNNGNGSMRNAAVKELAKFFSDINTTTQWYLPTTSGSNLEFKWSEDVPNAPDPITIDISSLIPLASETTDGRMSSADKITLDELAKGSSITPDDVKKAIYEIIDNNTIVIEDGVMKAVNTNIARVVKIILTADQWDTTTKTQKIPVELNTDERNVIDVDVASLSEWTSNGVVAISENSTGITFSCEQIPLVNLTCYLTSMPVIYDGTASAGTRDRVYVTETDLYKGMNGDGTIDSPATGTILDKFKTKLLSEIPSGGGTGNVSFDEYETGVSIKKGQFVIYNHSLFKALQDISAEENIAWDDDKFELAIGGDAYGFAYEQDGVLYIRLDSEPQTSHTIKNGIVYI